MLFEWIAGKSKKNWKEKKQFFIYNQFLQMLICFGFGSPGKITNLLFQMLYDIVLKTESIIWGFFFLHKGCLSDSSCLSTPELSL